MPINTNTFESNLTTKINATSGTTDAKEFLLLGKAIEAVTPTVVVQDVIDEGDTQITRVQTEGTTQVAAVQAAGSGYAALTGATFTGGISGTTASFSGDVSLGDNDKAIFGAGSDLQIYHDSATGHSIITESGGGALLLRGENLILEHPTTGNNYLLCVDGPSGYVKLYQNGSEKLATTSTGIDVTGELIADSYNETYAAVTSSSNATTVNCEAGNAFSHTLTENTTFTFSNPPASGTAYSFSIEIIQDASASGYTVTWPTSVDWPSATAPTLTATASAKDVFVFTTRDGGTTWYGFTAGLALA